MSELTAEEFFGGGASVEGPPREKQLSGSQERLRSMKTSLYLEANPEERAAAEARAFQMDLDDPLVSEEAKAQTRTYMAKKGMKVVESKPVEMSAQDFFGLSPLKQTARGAEPEPQTSELDEAARPARMVLDRGGKRSRIVEESVAKPEAPSTGSALTGLKALGAESAAVADFALGLATFPYHFGARVGGTLYGLATGEGSKSYTYGKKVAEELAEPISNPMRKLMALFNSGEAYDATKTAQGMQVLSQAIQDADDFWHAKAPEHLPKDSFGMLVDTLFFGLPGVFGKGGALTVDSNILRARNYIQEARKTYSPADRGGVDFTVDAAGRAEHTNPFRAKAEQQKWEGAAAEVKDVVASEPDVIRSTDALPPRMKMKTQAGEASPEFLQILATAGMTAGTGLILLNESERTGRPVVDVMREMLKGRRFPSAEDSRQIERENERLIPTEEGGLLAGKELLPFLAPLAAGAIKGKGGMWHPEALGRLTQPLREALIGRRGQYNAASDAVYDAGDKWSDRAVRNWLNKHAGTKEDPLRDVEIPFGEGTKRWEEVTDKIVKGSEARTWPESLIPGISKAKPDEMVWSVLPDQVFGREVARETKALESYLSHVGDYLRQNVPPEKLGQYDLVRAVKETVAADLKAAKAMEKAQSASMKDLPVYKEYPDGFRWVELKLPEKLTEEQGKGVKRVSETNEAGQKTREAGYVAVGADGKPIKSSWTESLAVGKTPEEAYIAGLLMNEGRTMGHSVGGYGEPGSYGAGGLDAIVKGDAKIFSLRDPKGKSHVTVEVSPKFKPGTNPAHVAPESVGTLDILQIKGKQNRAPVAEYLPYVQDFVRGGKWGEVRDLENTGLMKHPKSKELLTFEEARARALTVQQTDWPNGEFYQRSKQGSIDVSVPQDVRRALQEPDSYGTRRVVEDLLNFERPAHRQGRTDQSGFASKELLLPLGAAGAALLMSDEHPIRNAILAGIGTYAAMRGKGASGTVGGGLDYALGAVSTRLGNISERLKVKAREVDRLTLKHVNQAYDAIEPWLTQTAKLSKSEFARVDDAYMSGDPAKMAEALQGKPELVKAYGKVRTWLDEVKTKQLELQRYKEGLVGYLPRVVKDLDGLKKAIGAEAREGLSKILLEAEAKMIKTRGRPLTEVEQSLIVNRYLFSEDITSHLPGFAKARRVKEVTPELRPFYESMHESLLRYASGAITDFETARFFGRDIKVNKQGERRFTDVDDSIGNVVAREMKENNWTQEQAATVRSILKSRFSGGEKAMSGPMADIRNITNIGLLGSLQSAATQLGDAPFVLYHHGLKPTLGALVQKITGETVKPAEFGLVNHLAEELASTRPSGKVLQKVFKVAFAPIDRFSKGLHLNASLIKNRNLSKTALGQETLARKWGEGYGEDFPQLIKDLQQSRRTDLVDSLLWNELADAQPISRMEMPQAYLDHPNGRVLYGLKTYALKQGDVIRRDAYQKIRDGERARGLWNLTAMASVLALSNVPGDVVKAWLSGEEIDLEPNAVEMLLRNFGLSRYSMEQSGKGELGKAATDLVKPAFLNFGDLYRKPEKVVQHIPIIGKTIYDRLMGGAEAREKAKEAAEKRERARKRKAEKDD